MTDREEKALALLRRVMDAPCSADAPCGQSSDPEIMALWSDVRAFLASSPAQEEKRYTLAEVEAAWESAKAAWHEVLIAGWKGDRAWEVAKSELVARLETVTPPTE
jgi:hypothetical protein